jgi:hypothetical protein
VNSRFIVYLSVIFVAALPLQGQWKVGNKEVQFHGFFQQGYLNSSNNNYLSMRSRGGTFSMTDGGLNASTRLSPKLRVGMQAYSRNIGDLGNGKVQVDWAFVDYRFSDTFGIRAGKVKTTLGLYNDTQDMEFVHTWGLLPQSLYPTDLRAATIAHTGGDIYGDIQLGKAGRFSYVAYIGSRPDDPRGGYYLGLRDALNPVNNYPGWIQGGDARWSVSWIRGLTIGYSYLWAGNYGTARSFRPAGPRPPPPGGTPYRFDQREQSNRGYVDFQRGAFRSSFEYQVSNGNQRFSGIPVATSFSSQLGWYLSAAYRVNAKLEVGTYYSRYLLDRYRPATQNNSIEGQTVTARFDINKFVNVKLEGHFLDGTGSPFSSRSFYISSNPTGLKPRTNILLVRTGFSF